MCSPVPDQQQNLLKTDDVRVGLERTIAASKTNFANAPIFTSQIRFPFPKKPCGGSPHALTLVWNEGMDQERNENRYKSVYQKAHTRFKNHHHAYWKFTLRHISFIHNTGQETKNKKQIKGANK